MVDDIRTRIDTRYMLETNDGALIYIRYGSHSSSSRERGYIVTNLM